MILLAARSHLSCDEEEMDHQKDHNKSWRVSQILDTNDEEVGAQAGPDT